MNILRHGLLALAVAALASNAPSFAASDEIRVVATIPDLADLVREVGGDRVDVFTITKGRENLHAVSARPSHLNALARADLFVQVGLSLETSFVPGLMQTARNPRIQPGQPGFCSVSEGFEAIDRPASLSRQGGDVHPQGNPHVNLDPRAGKHMARKILEALARVDPGSKELYQRRFDAFAERYDQAFARWKELASTWKGRKVVVYHLEYAYLADCWGLDVVGSIELKPGIPATPNHLAELVARMRERDCRVILTATWSNDDAVAQVARATKATVVELPNQVGGARDADTWLAMIELVHRRVAAAFEPRSQ